MSLRARVTDAPSTLPDGDQPIDVPYTVERGAEREVKAIQSTWNELFTALGTKCLDKPTDGEVYVALRDWVSDKLAGSVSPRLIDVNAAMRLAKLRFVSVGALETENDVVTESHWTMRGQTTEAHPVLRWIITDFGKRVLARLIGVTTDRDSFPAAQTQKAPGSIG